MRLPRSIRTLLLGSLVFELGRAIALPFLAVYLMKHMGASPRAVGFMVTASLTTATLFGLYAGYLADRFDKLRLIRVSTAVAALATLTMVVSRQPWMAVLALTATDAALSLRYVSLKSSIAERVEAGQRARAFTINYTLLNVAHAVGPLLGVAVAGFGLQWTFVASAGCATLSLLVARNDPQRASYGAGRLPGESALPEARTRPALGATLAALRGDRRLVLFVLGGLLSALAYGRFSVYLAQYLALSQGIARAAATIPYLIATNAVAVVLLQYPIGKLIRPDALLRWIVVGSAMFALGLIGFAYAQSLPMWMFSMLLFTLGEVIVAPAEYLFIDTIAPPALKGSYYGAQGLTMFGSAFGPLICGTLLESAAPRAMFVFLVAAVLAGAELYRAGSRGTAARTTKVRGSALLDNTPRPEL